MSQETGTLIMLVMVAIMIFLAVFFEWLFQKWKK